MTRTANKAHYKWHATGTLCGVPVDRCFLSITHFIDEYGGDKTPLQLNRQKVNRLRNDMPCADWGLQLTPIRKKRTATVVYSD